MCLLRVCFLSSQYCARCIEVVCEFGPGGVGKCPNCRRFLRVNAAGRLEVAERTGTCTTCRQSRVIVEERGPHIKLCDGCLLGTRHRLRYECDGCGRIQVRAFLLVSPTPLTHQPIDPLTHLLRSPSRAVPAHPAPDVALPADAKRLWRLDVGLPPTVPSADPLARPRGGAPSPISPNPDSLTHTPLQSPTPSRKRGACTSGTLISPPLPPAYRTRLSSLSTTAPNRGDGAKSGWTPSGSR